ncbi:Protein tyrosine kinase [Babesia microti strain RI]|uniref:Cyclin-dependent kinase 2 homolog n=1 Tax=Babesia microti (strain RI) TaxID=1133968 RepID=I7JA15_BABMR|nr:Protein tyrosine kinase [Babesia microti strain RI]CCF73554.1 Protein tyrosine kinase [Babesia microti strain RI]|eukprot:XP_012648163.1 Protein tyrosine kinase [Babesia microti strain RI]
MFNGQHPFCKKICCGVSDPLLVNIADIGFNLAIQLINTHSKLILQTLYAKIDEFVSLIDDSKLELALARLSADLPLAHLAKTILYHNNINSSNSTTAATITTTKNGVYLENSNKLPDRLNLPVFYKDLLNKKSLLTAQNISNYYHAIARLFGSPSIHLYLKQLQQFSTSQIAIEKELYSSFKKVTLEYFESTKIQFTTYLTHLSSKIGPQNLLCLSQESNQLLKGLMPLGIRNFVKIHQVGQGAYGDVWLAEDIVNQRTVALKKLKLNEEREGFPKTSIREILLLNSLKHKNIVNLLGIVHSNTSKVNVWMVFEYMPFDLSGYIEALRDSRDKREKFIRPATWFSTGEVKNIMLQLFRALAHCHKNNVIHRDLKSANMLISNDGTMKLADFGLARFIPLGKGVLTNRVVTLWYRPPELLLGSETYDASIDIWSAGCIMAELLCGTPLFAADKEPLMLKIMAERLNLPSKSEINHLSTLPLWNNKSLNPLHPEKIGCIVPRAAEFEKLFKTRNEIGDDGWDLLKSMLRWDSNDRISASDALLHPWFKNPPCIEPLKDRPNVRAAHSFMTKNQRKREMAQPVSKKHETYVKHALAGHLRNVSMGESKVEDEEDAKKRKRAELFLNINN